MAPKTKQVERRAKRNLGGSDNPQKEKAERDECSMRCAREVSLTEGLAHEQSWKQQLYWVVTDAAFDRIRKACQKTDAGALAPTSSRWSYANGCPHSAS